MDLAASFRTLGRQWILTFFLLILTFAAGVAAWVKLPGPYSAESMVALVPSHQESIQNGNNAYLSYNGSEVVAGDIVLRQVMAPATVLKLAGQGYTGAYTIADDPNTTGPILDITVTGKSKAVVESTLRGVTDKVQAQLTTLQQSLAPADQISSIVASYAPTASLEVSKKMRVIVLVVGLGLVLTFALPQIVDAEVNRRRGRRAGADLPAGGSNARDYQQEMPPHRRRFRPTAEPEQMPESVPAATPYAERSRGGRSEQMPESVPAVRPYAERSRGLDGATPPTGTPADGTTARPPGADRDRPHRREFTY
ncbi:MAG: hypothetical protein QOJ73_46 [Streptosporangiaceae bacterium]|jgi:hypothetical protein|nr:hypothetical protein [Streptosporangiaceae bacterium]